MGIDVCKIIKILTRTIAPASGEIVQTASVANNTKKIDAILQTQKFS